MLKRLPVFPVRLFNAKSRKLRLGKPLQPLSKVLSLISSVTRMSGTLVADMVTMSAGHGITRVAVKAFL